MYEENNAMPTVKHDGRLVMLGGCFAFMGIAKLLRAQSTMDSTNYQERHGFQRHALTNMELDRWWILKKLNHLMYPPNLPVCALSQMMGWNNLDRQS